MILLIWIAIGLCISQSAMLSGLNLAFFSVSKLELQIEAADKNPRARRILALPSWEDCCGALYAIRQSLKPELRKGGPRPPLLPCAGGRERFIAESGGKI